MRNGLDSREQAIENKFAHDQHLEFRMHSRRNRLLSSWAAEIMQMNDYQANEYVNKFIKDSMNFKHEEQVLDLIFEDCQRAFVKIDKDQIKKQGAIFKSQAYHDVMSDKHN